MKRSIGCLITLLTMVLTVQGEMGPFRGPVRESLDRVIPNRRSVVHHQGNVRIGVGNSGYFGAAIGWPEGDFNDPCYPHGGAPQGEYPPGSGIQYLYRACLWVGAIIVDDTSETPRVSVGFDGWFDVKEMFPGDADTSLFIDYSYIHETSNIPGKINCFGDSVFSDTSEANEEFIATYSDTLTDPFYVNPDNDGSYHRPLGIEIKQVSRAWGGNQFADFIIFTMTVKNMGNLVLKNPYLGLYDDCDVGGSNEQNHHTDDITGFLQVDTLTGDSFNIAYIADNDGRGNGGGLTCTAVSGIYVLVPPEQNRRFSFNWFVPNAVEVLDYSPAWESYALRDSNGLGWEDTLGTPIGDLRKYQMMSNGEIDFDQVYTDQVNILPPQHFRDYWTGQTHDERWASTFDDPFGEYVHDIANGYDARFMISWGPLGNFDHVDPEGRPVYLLNPGEEFSLSFAYVMGPNFHNPAHPQPDPTHIDPHLFDFTGLLRNARRAKFIFDQQYSYQPPVPPNNFIPTGSFDSAVNLLWTPPTTGTVQGYNLYGRNSAGQDSQVQFNSGLITNTSYTVNNLANGNDWQFQIETVDDSGFTSEYADTLVRVGAILPLTGLTAVNDSGVIHLNWTASNDPSLVRYRILKRPNIGDPVSYISADANFLDANTQPGYIYTYWVAAENNRNLTSYLSDSVTVVAWRPQHRILVIDETKPANQAEIILGGIADSMAVRNLYEQILTELTEPYDYLLQRGTVLNFSFEEIAQYDLVIWHSEDNTIHPYSVAVTREDLFRTYLQAGGKLIKISRRLLEGKMRIIGEVVHSQFEMRQLLPLTFDSLHASPVFNNWDIQIQFSGATSADAGFPSFSVDTAKTHALRFGNTRNLDYLPQVDLFWPRPLTEVLYRANVLPTDTSGWDNEPCAVMGYGEVVLAFPLYFMHYEDARNVLAASIQTARSFVNGVEEPREIAVPTQAKLYPNFPNPFNPTTEIRFDVPQNGAVELAVFNLLGQKVTTLVSEVKAAGSYRVFWNGKNDFDIPVASGVYLSQLRMGNFAEVKKMVLLK